MRRPTDDVVRGLAFAFQKQIGFADRISLGVDILSIEVRRDFLAVLLRKLLEGFLADGQHSTGAAGAVVEQIRPGLNSIGNRQKDKFCHQLDRVARRPVLAGLFVVFLVEAPHQFLEDRPHRMVVESGMLDAAITVENRIGAKIDIRG